MDASARNRDFRGIAAVRVFVATATAGVGIWIAGCAADSPQAAPSASPVSTATADSQSAAPTSPSSPSSPSSPAAASPPAGAAAADSAGAVTAARDFLTRVGGMADVAGGTFRQAGGGIAEVDFHPGAGGEDGRPLPAVVTTVSLQRAGASWSVTGARTDTIQVDAPSQQQAVSAPVQLRGRAWAYEGTVAVRVVEVDGDAVAQLGRGFVTGGGSDMQPFSGQVEFTRPGGGTGWVVFFEESAVNGEVMRVSAVPVSFASR